MADTPRLEEAVEFAENPEPRCPCVLLLDTSASMQGNAVAGPKRDLQGGEGEVYLGGSTSFVSLSLPKDR